MNINLRILTLCLLLVSQVLISWCSAQEYFRVMFYNTENLFDTISNPSTLDDAFTPDGELHWNTFRYTKKIEDVSRVISSVGGEYPPAIVALCEVENKQVLDDLVKFSSLARHQYRYTITNSKDARGANIALLYQRDQFRYLSQKTYRPRLKDKSSTRDILHITGMLVSGDTLDIFVCHLPSRIDGVQKTEPKRCQVADLLHKQVDKLMKIRLNPYIVVMGDFNDYPINNSLKRHLKALNVPAEERVLNSKVLYNLFESKTSDEIQSYKYNGKWGYLDQFLVSGLLLKNNSSTHLLQREAFVFSPSFLLTYDEKHGGVKPLRTYSGWTYLGGTSDHLPIYFDLFISE